MHRISKEEAGEGLSVRLACEADITEVEDMVNDFVKGHPAEKHARSRSALREAYFGDVPVANLVVAVREFRVIGMGQWTRIYDMFWSMYGGNVEWLYIRPEHRGCGVVVAIVAEICAEVRKAGGEFLHGGGDDDVERLYERAAIGCPTHECHLSAEAFQVFADLAGSSPREIVRRLPSSELNRVPARSRS
ncbi:MAG TPA: GNAT family N-acetyltransferase [Bryobacteraceae bacterium]